MASPAVAKLPPGFRLSYLPFRAMAETIRFVLAHSGYVQGVDYEDEVVYGPYFSERRRAKGPGGVYPFDKVPVVSVAGRGGVEEQRLVIAQSASLARYAGRLGEKGGRIPALDSDPAWYAYNDSILELGQEMCTVNPTLNCYTGRDHAQMKGQYLRRSLVTNMAYLDRQLREVVAPRRQLFFCSAEQPGVADFNIFHHIDNAETLYCLEQDADEASAGGTWTERRGCLFAFLGDVGAIGNAVEGGEGSGNWDHLRAWYDRMKRVGGGFGAYLKMRPKVVGVGRDPGLRDRNGRVVRQGVGRGRLWLKEGLFVEADEGEA